jgi:hypothetical protein
MIDINGNRVRFELDDVNLVRHLEKWLGDEVHPSEDVVVATTIWLEFNLKRFLKVEKV